MLDRKKLPTVAVLPKGEISYRMQMQLDKALRQSSYAIAGVLAYDVAELVNAPFAVKNILQPLYAGSAIFLMGINYGVLNDIIGCLRSLPYFSLGHQKNQRSVIKSNNPVAQGIAWGFLATAPLSKLAAIGYSGIGVVYSYSGKQLPESLVSVLTGKVFLTLGLAIASAQIMKPILSPAIVDEELSEAKNLNLYQTTRLRRWLVSDNDKRNWLANSLQNFIGYLLLPLLAMTNLIELYKNSDQENSEALPAHFGSLFGIVLSLTIILSRMYLNENRDKQTANNPYRLDFLERKPSPMDDMFFQLENSMRDLIKEPKKNLPLLKM